MNNQFFDMQKIQKKILVNLLTLLRIPISIAFNLVLLYIRERLVICSILFLILFLTDFWDGKLARYYHVETKIGAILDAGTDFFFIFTTNYILYEQGLLPLGMVLIIILKFIEFCFTSYLLNRKRNKGKAFFFDDIGRFIAIVLYTIPLIVIILQALANSMVFHNIIFFIYIMIGALSLFSFCIRILKIVQYKIEIEG